jgi:metal-sulfur cluster biosynthetic enzyme
MRKRERKAPPQAAALGEGEVWEALRFVEDPELGIDVVNLGLVYEVRIEGALVRLRMTLTSIGCPAAESLEFQVKEALGSLEGVERVELEWTFDPPWSPERISEEGRDALISLGYL